jgi:molybdate transport system regulatory protein
MTPEIAAGGAGPRPQLTLLDAAGHRAGEERFRLLAEIARLGSIAAAAKAVGISYKAAWDAVDALNNLFPRPLVAARPGGRHGGGAELTLAGHRALAAHQQLTRRLNELFRELSAALGEGGAAIPLNPLIWSLTMKTSARNCYYGTISAVKSGEVSSEIVLDISPTNRLAVVITNESAFALGLHPGRQAFALIKASSPILVREADLKRTSARNCLTGSVSRIVPGLVNCEVVLDLGDGKKLAAVITKESADALGFEIGDRVSALVKASQIILCVD